MYTIFKVNADGTGGPKEIGEDLQSLQAEVGGLIEVVHLFFERVSGVDRQRRRPLERTS